MAKEAISVKLESNKDLVLKATQEQIEAALEAIGIQAEGYAKLLCRVDTGLLRNSITHAVFNQGAAIQKYEADKAKGKSGKKLSGTYKGKADSEKNTVFVGTNVEYAPYIEMGTKRIASKPFIKPAMADHVDEYLKLAEEIISVVSNI